MSKINNDTMGEMMRLIKISIIVGLFLIAIPSVFACDTSLRCEDITQSFLETCNPPEVTQIGAKCADTLASLEKAAAPNREELDNMNRAIAAFEARIKTIEADVTMKAREIAQLESELSTQLTIASAKIREFYIRSFMTNSMYLLLSSDNIGSVLRTIGYQQAAVNEDKKVIAQTAINVKDLEDRKKALVDEQASLATLKADTDKRAAAVRDLLARVDAYAGQLQSAIAAVSARQQEFLAAKLAGLGIPLFAVSGGGCSSDLTNGKDPGFSGGFGFFTFGVPNRVGLNQYGALGRAQAGQNADQILHAYYNFDGYQNADTGITIRVNDSNGFNSGNIIWSGSLNDYVKRIYEVPGDWPYEAIKAQVVAVRSYVLAATNNGSASICANQNCQVFQTNSKGGTWEQAVNDSGGQIMVQGGSPIKAFFSSTHGGYAFNTGDLQGWSFTSYTKRMVDTQSGSVSGFSDLRANAYDRASPWFYCDWGGRSSYGGTAWLKPEEVADIVNVLLLAKRDGSTQEHLVQPDRSNPDGVDTWDAARVRSELSSRGGTQYNSVSDISISFNTGTGQVTGVTVSGDGGTNTFDGNDFKTYFNLRAPANIQIVGPLYNVEKH